MIKKIILIIIFLGLIFLSYLFLKKIKILEYFKNKNNQKIDGDIFKKLDNNLQQIDKKDEVIDINNMLSDESKNIINKLMSSQKLDIIPRNKLYFKILCNDKINNINIDLYDEIVPLTVKNFVELSLNYYKNSVFYKLIKDILIQGGDFINNDGSGMYSIYGKIFDDENFHLKHNKPYLLSMINQGANTNNCNFCITFAPLPMLDGKNVVFGAINDILSQKFVQIFNNVSIDNLGRPIDVIKIIETGLI